MTIEKSEAVSLVDAADQLDVHYMTAYRYVRTGRMIATKRAGQWWVSPADIAAVIAARSAQRPIKAQRPSSAPALTKKSREMHVESFVSRLIVGDTAGCWAAVTTALHSGAPPAHIYRDLIEPAMIQIGEGWSQGTVSVAEEHRATASTLRLIGQMGPLFRHRGRRNGTIIVGAVAGDHHSVPSAMLADFLCDLRFDVVDLGGNAPADSFIDVARDVEDLIGLGLGASLNANLAAAIDQARTIKAALPEVFVLVGGSTFANASDAELLATVDAVSRTAADACASFQLVANA